MGLAHPHGRQHDAFVLEVFHHGIEAFVFFPQQISGRNAHVIKKQFCRVGTAPAVFFQGSAHAETRSAFFHDKHGNTAGAFGVGIGFSGNDVDVAQHSVGDKDFAAVNHPVVTIAYGPSFNARHIGAGGGFGYADGGNFFTGNYIRQVLLFLCFVPRQGQVGRCHVGVHQGGDGNAGKAGAAQFFRQYGGPAHVHATAAVFFFVG